jgi:hypothetical protein
MQRNFMRLPRSVVSVRTSIESFMLLNNEYDLINRVILLSFYVDIIRKYVNKYLNWVKVLCLNKWNVTLYILISLLGSF